MREANDKQNWVTTYTSITNSISPVSFLPPSPNPVVLVLLATLTSLFFETSFLSEKLFDHLPSTSYRHRAKLNQNSSESHVELLVAVSGRSRHLLHQSLQFSCCFCCNRQVDLNRRQRTRNSLDCDQSNYSSRIVFSHIPIEFGQTGNSTIRSADPKNPTLDPNTE